MSAVSEWVVREYLETQGFLVSQPRKYVAAGRQRKAGEEFDFLAVNPSTHVHSVPEGIIWDTAALRGISRAIVGVRGWHSERFSTATFEHERRSCASPKRARSRRRGGAWARDPLPASFACRPARLGRSEKEHDRPAAQSRHRRHPRVSHDAFGG